MRRLIFHRFEPRSLYDVAFWPSFGFFFCMTKKSSF